MMVTILTSLALLTILITLHGLISSTKAFNISIHYIDLIAEHNMRCIDLNIYDEARIDYDIRPNQTTLMWRLFFFRSYDDLIHPELKALEK